MTSYIGKIPECISGIVTSWNRKNVLFSAFFEKAYTILCFLFFFVSLFSSNFFQLKEQEKNDLLIQYKTLSNKAEMLETNVQQSTGEASLYRKEMLQKEQVFKHLNFTTESDHRDAYLDLSRF